VTWGTCESRGDDLTERRNSIIAENRAKPKVDNLSVRQAIGEPPPGEGETLVDRKTRCGRSLFHIVKVGAGVKREISKDEQNG